MKCTHIPFDAVDVFSHNDVSYATLHPDLREFYLYEPHLEAFPKVIESKEKSPCNRTLLHQVLRNQYQQLSPSSSVSKHVDWLLKENTFTITTAHQPSLFTGPLYYIYKIISTIKLAQTLNGTYPQYHFVPVFWMGAEDHDFEEINHAKIFRETLVWENEESGSVGAMQTAGLQHVLGELKTLMGESVQARQLYKIIEKAYSNHTTYGAATIELTHELFKDKGLVIIDSSDMLFKKEAIPLFRKEILEMTSEALVKECQNKLVEKGFRAQAFPRPVNLFFTGYGGFRERIDYADGQYSIVNKPLVFDQEQMITLLEQHPDMFSPNVIMRPLYQEFLLPNLAYIGGGGELAYWLERKEQFEHFGIPYPMLIRRDSVLWLDAGSLKKMKKLELDSEDLWKDVDILIKNIVKNFIKEENKITKEKEQIHNIYRSIIEKISWTDQSLESSAKAEASKVIKGLEQLEAKQLRAEKRKNETVVNQIKGLKEKLFPNGNLQERKDNFIPYYIKHGATYFDVLLEYLDPLDRRVKIIEED